MSDRDSELLSAWIDGELEQGEHERLLQRLKRDPALRRRWNRYHMIGEALSGHPVACLGEALADRVAEALESEPTILTPRRPLLQRALKPLAGVAVAASVAVVAIVTLQNSIQQGMVGPQLSAKAPAPERSGVITVAAKPAVQRELNRYLLDHSHYTAGSRAQGLSPIRRIAVVHEGVE